MTGPILVTGGAGSAGRKVVARLLAEGEAVRVFDLPNLSYAGLEGEKGVEVVRGDITKNESVQQAVNGVSSIIHLAALLPPASERKRELTFAVNVDGTIRLAQALNAINPGAPLVFSSSVSTYGDTTSLKRPVTVDVPQHALDIYADTKIQAEKRLREVYPQTTVLRISGISVPAFQEPPPVWPFMADQRIEFIHRDDVVAALCNAASAKQASGCVFNIAGGRTWRTTGKQYVADYYGILGVPFEEAKFQDKPGWCDWYDTTDSQRVLKYQNTPYNTYLDQIRTEVEKLMQA